MIHAPLSELVEDVQSGFACGESVRDGVVQLRMNNVSTEGAIDLTSMRRVPRNSVRELDKFMIENGDVMFNNTNSPELVGKSAVFRGFSEPVVFSNHFTRIRVRRERLDPRYLARWLASEWRRRRFARMCNQWVNQASVRKEALLAMDIPTPPVPEQRRIADILDKADTIRNKRRDAVAMSEELLRSTFLDMVGPAARGYGSWPVDSIESLAAKRPNAMRTGPFGSDLLHSEFVDEGVAVLGIDNAVQNRFAWGERRFISPDKYERLRRYTVYPGDVIVTIMGTTGRSAVVPADIPVAITTKHLATITLDCNRAEPEFVSHALFRHPEVLRQIASANQGAIMSGLNLGLIKALRVPIPPIERQREFSKATVRIREMTTRMEQARLEEQLFNSLVRRAFSGEIGESED